MSRSTLRAQSRLPSFLSHVRHSPLERVAASRVGSNGKWRTASPWPCNSVNKCSGIQCASQSWALLRL
jgi:hypothetical protein